MFEKKLVFTTLTTWLARAVSAMSIFVVLRVLNAEISIKEVSIFIVIIGLVGWFSIWDMGLSIISQNNISKRISENRPYSKIKITSLWIVMLILVFSIPVNFLISNILVSTVFENLFISNLDGYRDILFYAIMLMTITACSGYLQRAWYAEGKGYYANVLMLSSSIISLILINFVSLMDESIRLLYSLFAWLGPQCVIFIVIVIASVKKVKVRHVRNYVNKNRKKALNVWILMILSAVVLQLDYVIAGSMLNEEGILTYFAYQKLFGLTSFMYAAVLLVNWPRFSENMFSGKYLVVQNLIYTNIKIGVFFSLIGLFVICIFFEEIIQILKLGQVVKYDALLIFCFYVYTLIRIISDTYSVVFQSKNHHNLLISVTILQGFLNFVFQYIFVKNFGVPGLVLGLILSYLFSVIWYFPYSFKKIRRHPCIN